MPDIFIDQDQQKKDEPTVNVSVNSAPPVRKKSSNKKNVVVADKTKFQTLPQDEETISDLPKHSIWQRIKEPLMAYVANPVGMHFESQEDKEQIILLLRRHPITNLRWIIAAILMLLAPMIIFPLFSFLNPFADLPLGYHLILTLFWYILTFSLVLVNFLHWYFNVYIVTNERIVDVDFYNLVHRELSSTRVSKIQDVTYKVNGVIRSVFDYGDVYIQTAGTEENFVFEAAPQPQMVVKKISELIEKHEERGYNNKPSGV